MGRERDREMRKRKRKRKGNTHIQHGKRRERVSWGVREPLAVTEERKSGSHKGRELLEQKRGMGTEWKIKPLPQSIQSWVSGRSRKSLLLLLSFT